MVKKTREMRDWVLGRNRGVINWEAELEGQYERDEAAEGAGMEPETERCPECGIKVLAAELLANGGRCAECSGY